jgi:hypothetical protein
MKKTILTAIAACLCSPLLAQNYTFPEVKDQGKLIQDLFEVKDLELNHHFTIAIGQGEYLVFEMEKLSVWSGKEDFLKYADAVLPLLEKYSDSLKKPLSTKRLDVHIPVQNTPLISRFGEQMVNSNLQAMSATETVSLKMTLDTLRIVKKFPDRKHQGSMVQRHFQYTWLLKDLKNAQGRLADKAWLSRTAVVIDSVVMAYRKKWNNQDAWNHHLFVSLDTGRAAGEQLQLTKQVSELNGVKTQDMILSSVGFGASLVRNTICPSLDIGLQVNFYSDYESTFFTRVSVSSFARFEEQANRKFKAYGTSFVNAELGFGVNPGNTKLKPYSLSVGFGYKLLNKESAERDPNLPKRLYRLFFNYEASKSIIVAPEFYTDFGTKSNRNSWMGLSVTFRLF